MGRQGYKNYEEVRHALLCLGARTTDAHVFAFPTFSHALTSPFSRFFIAR